MKNKTAKQKVASSEIYCFRKIFNARYYSWRQCYRSYFKIMHLNSNALVKINSPNNYSGLNFKKKRKAQLKLTNQIGTIRIIPLEKLTATMETNLFVLSLGGTCFYTGQNCILPCYDLLIIESMREVIFKTLPSH